MTQSFRWMGLCLLLLGLCLGRHDETFAVELKVPSKPNVVVILCDDLGYGDVKCLNPNGKIATPHLDRLAKSGMTFTDAHTGSAVCTPTRYGLMTGRYAWRTKLQSGVLGGLSPRLIEPNRMTVASLLKRHGYHTACVGKWHLGMDWVRPDNKPVTELNIEPVEQNWNVDYAQPIANGPNSVGFDRYFGISASLDMVPYTFIENDRVTIVPTVEKSFPLMLGREGKPTRKGPAATDFEASDVLPTLTQQAIAFVTQRAADAKKDEPQRTPFFLYVPLASPHTPIATSVAWRGKSGLNPYADFVMETDNAIGQMLDALDNNGLTDNTLVIVTSDNGCSPQADFDDLLAKGHNPNYLFRGHKADIYEGGHRVPFLVRWPSHVATGSTCDNTICLTDVMATCAEIVGEQLADTAAEDSVSFVSALLGKTEQPKRPAVVHHSINGSFAIRDGEWKLCLCPGSGGWSKPRPAQDDVSQEPLVQLFDLVTDIGEQKNLAATQPDIVARLTRQLESFVANGRSTPGQSQKNAVVVDLWKAGKQAHQPKPTAKAKKSAS